MVSELDGRHLKINPIQPPLPYPSTDPIIPLNFPIATKLNPNNYLTWKSQIQPIIHGFNLTRFLNGPVPAKTIQIDAGQIQDNPVFHPWNLQDQFLLGWIRSSLTEGIQAQFANRPTTCELWSTLRQIYSATSRARLTDLKRQLQTTTKGASSCTDYLHTIHRIADELAFCGSLMPDEDLVMAVLNGLGPEFDSFVISVTTSGRHSPFTFADLHGHLLSHESRLQGHTSNTGLLPSQPNLTAFIAKTNNSYHTQSNNYQNRPNNHQNRPNNYQTQTNNYQNLPPNQYHPQPNNQQPRYPNTNSQTPPKPTYPSNENPKPKAHFNDQKSNYQANSKPQCQICTKFGHVAKECYFRYEADPTYQS